MTRILKKKLSKPTGEDQLDRKMKSLLNPISSRVVDKIFPHGMLKRFPNNNFALMVLSGGKGSSVNISQISALLGQQELEGRRVPRMRTGKTLPAFGAFGLGAEEGGYIADRFLTGINPKVYFFHCMAGREGLVDTAVKTARSGYLQRCVVKNMENVQVRYDQTVRGQNDCVLQFYYGEDGLDPVKAAYLKNFDFVRLNHIAYSNQIGEKDIYHVNVEAVNDYYEKFIIVNFQQ